MKKSLFSRAEGAGRSLALLLATGALAMAAAPAHAQTSGFDVYVGGSIGQSNADIDDLEIPDFDDDDMAWKLFGGVRFASMFGAELNYIDFGNPGGDGGSVEYQGLAAYGLFYVPLPIPVLDIYVKAGIARLEVDVDPFDFSTDDTRFTYGLGVLGKFGRFAVRGEYERFEISDGNLDLKAKPSLFSLGVSYSFL